MVVTVIAIWIMLSDDNVRKAAIVELSISPLISSRIPLQA